MLHSSKRAQLSLEYLLLLAAFFSSILLFMPTIAGLYANAEFATDIHNAERFLHELESASEKMLILGKGSQMTLKANVLTTWRLSINNSKAFLTVKSASLNKEKTIKADLAAQLFLPEHEFNSAFKMLIIFENGKILIQT